MDSELELGQRGVKPDSSSLYVTISETGTYDYQNAGPSHRPVLKIPDPAERLRRLLSWDIQREIFNDLTAVEHATQISNVLAAFFVLLPRVWDDFRRCTGLLLSEDECKENYLAQAWCWRVHRRALGIRLEVEHSILRNWMQVNQGCHDHTRVPERPGGAHCLAE